MKKAYIIVVNVIIMITILIFVVLYSGYENRISYQRQIEHFEDTTVTMEQVTENYRRCTAVPHPVTGSDRMRDCG